MTTTFENAHVGDRVWSIVDGWGIILNIQDISKYDYPLIVDFDSGYGTSFTISGLKHKEESQTLFWDEIKFEVPVQPPRMKLIHGVEVPDISFKPKDGEGYYAPSTSFQRMYARGYYIPADLNHKFMLKYNFCYPPTEQGKQAAILHAKAMLGIKD